MRRIMLVILVIAVVMAIVSCSDSQETSMMEVDISSIKSKDFQAQIQDWERNNGAYLVQRINKNDSAYYLFLNAHNIMQGSKPTSFEDIKVDFEDTTMKIYYSEKESGDQKNIRNKVLYRIPLSKAPEIVKIYKNGVESHFETISIIED